MKQVKVLLLQHSTQIGFDASRSKFCAEGSDKNCKSIECDFTAGAFVVTTGGRTLWIPASNIQAAELMPEPQPQQEKKRG